MVSLDITCDERIGLQFLAALEGVSLSQMAANLLRQAVNLDVCAQHASQLDPSRPCPQCDWPTRPDPDRPGAWCCDRCGEAVSFEPIVA